MDKKFRKVFEKKAKYLEDALLELERYYNAAKTTGFSKVVWLANLSIYSLVVEYDLWIYMCAYGSSDRKFVQNSYARLACVSIVESIEDILQMMGRNYQEFYSEIIDDKTLRDRAMYFKKTLSDFKIKNEKEMREIRNYVMAHREHNIEKQIEVFINMNIEDLMSKSMQYLYLIEELHYIFNDTIKYMNKKMDANDAEFVCKIR